MLVLDQFIYQIPLCTWPNKSIGTGPKPNTIVALLKMLYYGLLSSRT